MEQKRLQLLFVGDHHYDPQMVQNTVSAYFNCPVQITAVPTYEAAVKAVQQPHDAVLISPTLDGHAGLEFIQHARLLGVSIPLILICEDYNDSLFYKARKIGASDILAIRPLPQQPAERQTEPSPVFKLKYTFIN